MMGKSDRSHPSACASRSSRCAIPLLSAAAEKPDGTKPRGCGQARRDETRRRDPSADSRVRMSSHPKSTCTCPRSLHSFPKLSLCKFDRTLSCHDPFVNSPQHRFALFGSWVNPLHPGVLLKGETPTVNWPASSVYKDKSIIASSRAFHLFSIPSCRLWLIELESSFIFPYPLEQTSRTQPGLVPIPCSFLYPLRKLPPLPV